jgi:drug/metabolite transporter (DMT)-like permease
VSARRASGARGGLFFGLNLAVFFAGATHNSVADVERAAGRRRLAGGEVFGSVAMLLLVAYVASTKHFRREMDVTTFMATICPIAAVAVVPLAIAHGDVFGMSGTGWTWMLILTFTSGSPPRGCWCSRRSRSSTIAQVAQPALAVVWSHLLLGEVVNERQAGVRDRHGRVAGLVMLHRRGEERRPGRAR